MHGEVAFRDDIRDGVAQPADLDFEAGLLAHLAPQRVERMLPVLDSPAGQPPAVVGLAYQQYPTVGVPADPVRPDPPLPHAANLSDPAFSPAGIGR